MIDGAVSIVLVSYQYMDIQEGHAMGMLDKAADTGVVEAVRIPTSMLCG